MSLILLAIGAYVIYKAFSLYTSLQHNIKEAKRSGLPYIVAPFHPFWRPWLITHKLWIPLIKRLPKSWWEDWMVPASPNFMFENRHDWFAKVGPAILVVSPRLVMMFTDNAEAIRHITLKREQFPKWTETYGVLKQFGENVLTTEGAIWRMHRKVTSSTFNEKNAALVFHEAIHQTQGMLGLWTGPQGPGKGPLLTLERDTMRLALNIIGYVGFGMRLLWPGQKLPPGTDPKLGKYGSLEPSEGHKMSFADTMEVLLENILILLLTPKWLLKRLPYETPQKALTSYYEYLKYMNELLDERIEDVRAGNLPEEGMDLMGQLAKASYGSDSDKNKAPVLTRDEIIGNAFIMFVAGHETTANTTHFLLVYLAMNPSAQRRLQKDVEELVGDADPKGWDYEKLVNPMMGSMLGAAMYETLRLMPPVVAIPKIVTSKGDQPIAIDGTKYVLPSGSSITLVAPGAHTNPRYWPSGPSKIHPGKDDLRDFVPERWFQTGDKEGGSQGEENVAGADTEDFGGFQGRDTSEQLFKPERGAYIPFSDGARSCLGRRIAQVELIAALAVVFQKYSIELAVDEWASPEEVEKMSMEQKAEVYRKAQDKTGWTLDQASTLLTLKLIGDHHIPVRLVRKGEEQFVNWLGH
ncbi:Cytochrome P450 monooxygenase ORF6-like protein [Cladobotryum mycophilum]|uniref:Cytochrome P450 monooxygenase ORF6-like protein n=1 Tax=Cladobotryum mycophilum TaxID=491253 RepID=A0ABR0S5N0_9HYPO